MNSPKDPMDVLITSALKSPLLEQRVRELELQVRDQARVIGDVRRAVERNEKREINMGEAWALIKEAVANPKLTK